MLEFAITNLVLSEPSFEVPSSFGQWEFEQAPNYQSILPNLEEGQCGNTYFAANSSIGATTSYSDFDTASDEIMDICLILSFLNSRCVTVSTTTARSDISFAQMPDQFIRPRSIIGFNAVDVPSITQFSIHWISLMQPLYEQRKIRLQLVHWLSGLTCYSMEDLYLSVGVQMDLVKQRERAATGNLSLTFFEGMQSASTRYNLSTLGQDYKNMRNDIVHEGVLSGSRFVSKSKMECAVVIADTLNWIDNYIFAALGTTFPSGNSPRWIASEVKQFLPAVSIR